MIELSRTFYSLFEYYDVVLQPQICIATHLVWALPRSLATTGGIISYFLIASVSQGIRHAPLTTFAK